MPPDEQPNNPGPEAQAAPAPETPPAAPAFDPEAFKGQIAQALGAELQAFRAELRTLVPGRPETKETPQSGIDWENEFYTDPKGTMERFAEDLQARITSDLVGRYEKEKTVSDFWSGFYAQNDHLREHDGIVRAILGAKERAWMKEGITVGQAYKRLEEATEAIGGKLERKKGPPEAQAMTIDGLAFVQQPARAPAEKVKTLSDAVRERQAKYRGG